MFIPPHAARVFSAGLGQYRIVLCAGSPASGADGKEKSAVATGCINEHFRFAMGQWCAMVGETVHKALAVNHAGLPLYIFTSIARFRCSTITNL
jgi:hypothetical protein